ncbi:hypothetical protein OE88DRAFT_1656166 [Heliocybe sulcata]|uniref:NAD dependent epimerase/dehydratase n=1 Tax=Heliocybe sulcata TaxID=5364 RepID=A0A5C3N920_9AGAM|nr:hypothetical protein OE88DRAFT_1656166 [Heliocybe sulcata]
MLGFGPFYHMFKIVENERAEEFDVWKRFGEGQGTVDDLDRLFKDCKSVLDYPAAMYAEQVYKAYPDAKFILTVRDYERWEPSFKSTIGAMNPILAAANQSKLTPTIRGMSSWWMSYGPLGSRTGETDLRQFFDKHNELVKKLIPPEQLLVYKVGEGWSRLVEFLGVSEPSEPFPHINDTNDFMKVREELERATKE